MYIAVDIGGTNIRIAASESLDTPKLITSTVFNTSGQYEKDLAEIINTIRTIGDDQIHGIGVGLPAIFDETKSKILQCPNLPSWNGKPLQNDLLETFSNPVVLENDASIAALGEGLYGFGKKDNFLFIIWGTGIGGTSVRHIDESIDISPSEPGHQIIQWDGPPCGCGQHGCLEALCSGRWIERNYGAPAEVLSDQAWEKVVEHFAQGMINLISIHPTKLIIFGGGVASRQPERIKQIHEIVKQRLHIFSLPEMKISKYGKEIGLYGAIGLQKQNWGFFHNSRR